MNHKLTLQVARYSLLLALAKVGSLCKVGMIFGSFHAFFSMSSITTPLFGLLTGTLGSIALFFISLSTRLLFGYGFSVKILAFYVPGLCASLYLARRSGLWAVVLPLACMAAFVLHPVGNQAMIYSLYWLIPMILFFIPKQTLFTHALTATFIAHAVGSALWLYTQPSTPEFWITLVPIVFLERFFYALGMVCVYKVMTVICIEKMMIYCTAKRHSHSTHR